MKNQTPFLVNYDIFMRRNIGTSLYRFIALTALFFALLGVMLLFLFLNIPMARWNWFLYLDVVLIAIYAAVVIKGRYSAKQLAK